MHYAYLASNVISMSVWTAFFILRKDIRRQMLVMSVLAMPLALFDLVFVPSYWDPITLGDIPVGIEGFIFSFSAGGLAATTYLVVTRHRVQPVLKPAHTVWLVLLLTLIAFCLAMAAGVPNPEFAAYIAAATGLAAMLYMRKDLASTSLYSALCFGLLYFIMLKVWGELFPDTHYWFKFEHMPKLFVWGVPGWESLFGFFFGAYWGTLYSYLFGKRLSS